MGKFKENFETDRDPNEIRDIHVELDFTPNALASILYKQGNTVVLCCVTKQDSLPRWFPRNATKGWVHAEYSLLPASTDSRFRRERNGAKGRTQEIERLIARSLRAAVNLEALGPIALDVDCDILNADGGTRCASISAANIALRLAIRRLIRQGLCLPPSLRKTDDNKDTWSAPTLTDDEVRAHEMHVMPHDLAAVSVGLIDDSTYLDLDYVLDSNADVDMNVIQLSDGSFVEIQGTGEEATFTREQLNQLLDVAGLGLDRIFKLQQQVLDSV